MDMRYISLGVFAAALAATSAYAQDDAQRSHAVDQLVGQWQVQVCDADGSCQSGEREYQYDEETGVVHYTEMFGGEQSEGYMGYDAEQDSFYTFNDPTDANSEIAFESRYNDDGTIGFYDEEGPERLLEWTIEDGGESMSMRAFGDTVIESPTYMMEAIFTRMPILNDDD